MKLLIIALCAAVALAAPVVKKTEEKEISIDELIGELTKAREEYARAIEEEANNRFTELPKELQDMLIEAKTELEKAVNDVKAARGELQQAKVQFENEIIAAVEQTFAEMPAEIQNVLISYKNAYILVLKEIVGEEEEEKQEDEENKEEEKEMTIEELMDALVTARDDFYAQIEAEVNAEFDTLPEELQTFFIELNGEYKKAREDREKTKSQMKQLREEMMNEVIGEVENMFDELPEEIQNVLIARKSLYEAVLKEIVGEEEEQPQEDEEEEKEVDMTLEQLVEELEFARQEYIKVVEEEANKRFDELPEELQSFMKDVTEELRQMEEEQKKTKEELNKFRQEAEEALVQEVEKVFGELAEDMQEFLLEYKQAYEKLLKEIMEIDVDKLKKEIEEEKQEDEVPEEKEKEMTIEEEMAELEKVRKEWAETVEAELDTMFAELPEELQTFIKALNEEYMKAKEEKRKTKEEMTKLRQTLEEELLVEVEKMFDALPAEIQNVYLAERQLYETVLKEMYGEDALEPASY